MLRRDEEIVFQKETGKKEAVPLVVSELLDKMFDLVGARFGAALSITQLSGLGTKFAPQVTLPLIHVTIGIRLMHGERFKRLTRAAFADLARLLDRAFQLTAKICGKSAHRITGPSFSFSSTCWRAAASHRSSSAALLMVAPP